MQLDEATQILKNAGYLVEYTSMYSALSNFYRYLKVKAPKTGYDLDIEGDENSITVKFMGNVAKVTLEQFDEDEDPMLYVEVEDDERAFYNEHTDYGPALQFIIKNICPTNESVNEAVERLNKAGLIAEETTEDALARIAANSNEAIVEEIVEEIEKVRPVKNYYEVDPDDRGVTQQFEIVMENATWEVQFRGKGAFYWRGNSYPWRIIRNNNGGFTQVAFSLPMLRSYMKKVKAINAE